MLGGGISVIPDTSTEFMNCSWYEPISACASQLCFSLCNFLRVVYQDGVLPRSLLDRTLCRCRQCTVSGWPPPYYLFLSDPSPIIGNACQWLPNSLTHWLLFSKLDWCDPGMWRWQLKTCWSCFSRLAMLVTNWLTDSLTHWLTHWLRNV